MIRTLIMVAVAGFLVSLASLTAAVVITGPYAVTHGAWTWSPNGWGRDWDEPTDEAASADRAPTSRQIAWSGGDTLTVALPADVQVARASGPASITLTGPARALSRVEIDDGIVRYASGDDDDPRLSIAVTAPTLTRVILRHRGEVTLADAPPRR
jgi:hypothetical protein